MKKTYGEVVMALTTEQSSKRAFKNPHKIVDESGIEKASYIIAVPVRFVRYIKYVRYLLQHKTTSMLERSPPEQSNVSFIQMLSPGNC